MKNASKQFSGVMLILVLLLLLMSEIIPVSVDAMELSQGTKNIVKRAYQMTNIQWTPKADIVGWGGGVTYRAGVTYTGLPYGQPVYASYVPWSTSLAGFLDAVNNSNSKMYTSYSSYNKKAPFYSIDCSAFVSWAWGLNSRQTTSTIADFANQISTNSYAEAQIGDCLNLAGSHVVLITDITYDSVGNISSIEISESTVAYATNYCCQRTRYGVGGTHTLSQLVSKYFGNGYILYRSKTRDSVTYTHCCAVPLEGDVCTICKYGHECSYTAQVTEQPGCITTGTETYTCSGCGDSYTKTLPARGHAYQMTVTAPTCMEEGFTTFRCSGCGGFYKDDFKPPTGHLYADGVCRICGLKDYSVVKGDLNKDGDVTSADAVMLARYLVDLQTLTEQQLLAADLNGDGVITSADAVKMAILLVDS